MKEIKSRPHVTVASDFDSEGLVFAWGAGAIYRSTDGGSSFVEVTLPTNASIEDLEEDQAGTFFAAVAGEGGDISTGGLLRSTDRGRTWDWVGQGPLPSRGLRQIVPLAQGRLLAVPSGTEPGGLLCSRDRGTTWDTTCA